MINFSAIFSKALLWISVCFPVHQPRFWKVVYPITKTPIQIYWKFHDQKLKSFR